MSNPQRITQAEATKAFREGRAEYDALHPENALLNTRFDTNRKVAVKRHEVVGADNIIRIEPRTIKGKVLAVIETAQFPMCVADVQQAISRQFGKWHATYIIGPMLRELKDEGKIIRRGTINNYEYTPAETTNVVRMTAVA